MAEEVNTAPTEEQPTTNVTTNDTGVSQGADENKQFNIQDIPEEGWAAIYKSGRFKTLNDRAKIADKLEAEKRSAEDALAKEQGKWKDLYEKKEAEVKQWTNRTVTSEIKAFAAKLNAYDINDVAALVDKSGVQLDDSGNVVGAEDAVKALFDSKPHLFNSNNNQAPTKVGSGTNPGDANNQGIPKFTLSEIQNMNPDEYAKNHDAIMKALATNQVVDDIKR